MKIIVQNCLFGLCSIDGKVYSSIKKGYVLLVGFTKNDSEETAIKMKEKLLKMRVFPDENGKTNLSIFDVNGEILSISQFTLYADLKHGNRPSFVDCLEYEKAQKLYDYFNELLKESGLIVKTGVFGADMKIELQNDGPFTMVLDSKELF